MAYTDLYSYHTENPTDDENMVYSVSNSRFDLLQSGDITMGELLPSDDVYTTFNPSKHRVLATSYMDYSISQQDYTTSGVSMRYHDGNPVNLRYGLNIARLLPGNEYDRNFGQLTNWDMTESQQSIYKTLFTGSGSSLLYNFTAPYPTYNNMVQETTPPGAQFTSRTTNPYFVTKIGRNHIFNNVHFKFSYIDDNLNLVSIDPPTETILDWANSPDHIYQYDGKRVFVTGLSYRAWYRKSDGTYTTNLFRKNIATGAITGSQNMSQGVFPFVETFLGDKLVHHNAAVGNVCCNIQEAISLNSLYQGNVGSNLNPIYGYINIDSNVTTGNAIYATAQLTNLDSGTDFLSGIYLYGDEPLEISPDDLQVIGKAGAFEIRGNYLISSQNNRSTATWGKYLNVSYIRSVGEIFSCLASLLIPFYLASVHRVQPSEDIPTFIGIRSEDGTVNGSYEPYDWTNPQTETEFRPENFNPIVPSPPAPPETDDSGNTRNGDSIALRAPTNLQGCAGFVTNYCLTNQQMQVFGSALWASFNDSSFWQALGAVLTDSLSINPADILKYIISLRCYPIDLISSGIITTDKFYIGRGTVGISLGSSVAYTSDMTIFKSCGSITVPEPTKSYLDYAPYRSISLYLPFCGEFELNATEISGSTLTVHYAVDLTTGICTSYVLSSYGGVEYPILTVSGQMGQDIQLSAGNLAPVAASLATVAISGLIGGATGAIAGGTAAAAEAGAMPAIGVSTNLSASGALSGALKSGSSAFQGGFYPSFCNPGASFNAFYAPMTPYLKIKTCRQQKPINFGNTQGNISVKTRFISDMQGFIQVVNPDLDGISATYSELSEIRSLLESGIKV